MLNLYNKRSHINLNILLYILNKITCHTPTTALAIKISKITNGSTKEVRVSLKSSCSSNKASTYIKIIIISI